MQALERQLEHERARIEQLCLRITGNKTAAQDLAQETMLEAWRNRHKLTNLNGADKWLSAIARNVCLRWMRSVGQEANRFVEVELDAVQDIPSPQDEYTYALEQHELAKLLDKALDLVPPETKAAFLARYIEELPIAEIAARLNTSEGALSVRLSRGRVTLERVLTHDFGEQFGVGSSDWQQTTLWCYKCGRDKLESQYNIPAGKLYLRCRTCSKEDQSLLNSTNALPQVLSGARTLRAAKHRLDAWSYSYYIPGLRSGIVTCVLCGQSVTPMLSIGYGGTLIDASCAACHSTNTHSLAGYALLTPEGQRFHQQQERIEFVVEQQLSDVNGHPAVLIAYQSVVRTRRFDFVFATDTYDVLWAQES
jgi:RNA polymerase sigma factor (sigma-70 family)